MRIVWIVLAGLWFAFLSFGVGPIPAPMRLLDLSRGLWAQRPQYLESGVLPGLGAPVDVAWDKDGVPHFFAANEADLYRAQGYVMASQRLFQLDVVTRQAAGRLSEWVGDKTMKYDRFNVRLGMRESAEKTLAEFMKDDKARVMITSFTEGINAYIDHMKILPPEYVLLGRKPEKFDPLQVVYMDKSLTFHLSGRSFALELSRLQQKLGSATVLDLFPETLPPEYEDYIVPDDPKLPLRAREDRSMNFFVTSLKEIPEFPLANPSNGSNNWAVGPKKSATGHSILANDTHLGYTLPNIWYENQLVTPEFNVYGVALVAVPGIVNGFNGRVAWGPTNGTTTVLDFFEIEFENETSNRYKYRGEWLEPTVRVEEIGRADGAPERVDVITTRLGQVLHREGKLGLVANWMGHRSQQEIGALRGLFTARDEAECRASFRRWAVPIQNFICADGERISLRHTGRVPKRQIGEGRFVMNGAEARDTLSEEVPEAFHPQLLNPPYVLSANQKIVGPRYPYYLGWDFEEPYRGMMIRRRLTAVDKLTPDDMIHIQNDAYDLKAATILPLLLKAVRDTDANHAALERLRAWNFTAEAAGDEAALFHAWYKEFVDSVFDKPRPKSMRVAWMLKRLTDDPGDSDRVYLGGRALGDVVTDALAKVRAGSWNLYNDTHFAHVARLPGFGSQRLPMDGSGTSIRGNHGVHGPTFKAVYALGPEPRVWMQVPGGNDGNPFSPRFERFVDDWVAGKMREVEIYKDVEDARARGARIVTFTGGSK